MVINWLQSGKKRQSSWVTCINKWGEAESRKWTWKAEERISWNKGGNEVDLGTVLEVSMGDSGGHNFWRLDI